MRTPRPGLSRCALVLALAVGCGGRPTEQQAAVRAALAAFPAETKAVCGVNFDAVRPSPRVRGMLGLGAPEIAGDATLAADLHEHCGLDFWNDIAVMIFGYDEHFDAEHMLAVVRGRAQVGLQVILYAWATVACSLLLIPVAGMGLLYSTVAVVTGIWFIYETHRLYNLAIRHEQVSPMRVFHGSIAYLSLLFLAIGVDPLLPF